MEEKKLPHDHGQSMERELEQMPSVDDFQTVADIFKQLGDGSQASGFFGCCATVKSASSTSPPWWR